MPGSPGHIGPAVRPGPRQAPRSPVLTPGGNSARRPLVQPGALSSLATVSRASGETYFDTTGTLQTAASGAPAFTADPSKLRKNWVRKSDGSNGFNSGDATGIAFTLVGRGVLPNGMPYSDYRYVGNRTNSQLNLTWFAEAAAVIPAVAGQTWTASVYVQLLAGDLGFLTSFNLKADERDSGGNALSTQTSVNFVGQVDGTLRRFTATRTLTNASTACFTAFLQPFFAANATFDFTLRIAGWQIEQAASASALIPTTGSVATAYDYGSRTNLLTTSSDAITGWSNKAQVTAAADTAIAPDGTATADSLTENTAASVGHYAERTATVADATAAMALSVYVKANGRDNIWLHLYSNDFNSSVRCDFKFSTGQATALTASGGALALGCGADVVGNGWYRVWVSGSLPLAGTQVRPRITLINVSTTYTGDGVSGIYVWGAQLETGSRPTAYLQTGASTVTVWDMPLTTRLQVYESRTNLTTGSAALGNAANGWISPAGVTTLNTTDVAAPDGSFTATKLTVTLNSDSLYKAHACTAATTYTWSVYLRLGTLAASSYKFAVYDETNATFIAADLVPTQTVTGAGWTRLNYTFTTPAGCVSVRPHVYRNSVAQSGTLYAWGAQLEMGSFATPYIPTTTAAVTRAADAISVPTVALFPNGEGTVLLKAMNPNLGLGGILPFCFSVCDGSDSNRIVLRFNGTNIEILTSSAGVSPAGTTVGAVSAGAVFKAGLSFTKADRVAVSLNGAAVVAAQNPYPIGLNTLLVGNNPGTFRAFNGEIELLQTLPYAAPDAALQRLVNAL